MKEKIINLFKSVFRRMGAGVRRHRSEFAAEQGYTIRSYGEGFWSVDAVVNDLGETRVLARMDSGCNASKIAYAMASIYGNSKRNKYDFHDLQ